jgi:hypothetical protein
MHGILRLRSLSNTPGTISVSLTANEPGASPFSQHEFIGILLHQPGRVDRDAIRQLHGITASDTPSTNEQHFIRICGLILSVSSRFGFMAN